MKALNASLAGLSGDRVISRLRAFAVAVVAAFVFVVAWLYRFNDPGGSFAFLTDDHFFYLVRGWQILFGDLPVRDFVDHGAPLYYYVAAAVQLLFGRGTLSEVAFSVTVLASCAAGVFLLCTRVSGSIVAGFLGAAFHVLLEPRFYNYPKILAYVVAIPALWGFADRPDRRRTAILAVVTVVAFLFRHDHGVFIAIGFAALLALMPSLSLRQRVRHALVYGALVLALLVPYLAFIELNGGMVSYFRTAATWAERDRARAEVEFPGVFDNPDGVSLEAQSRDVPTRVVGLVRDNAVAWLFYGELALPLVALLLVAFSPHAFLPRWSNAGPKVATVAALGIALNAGFLRSPLSARLADPSVPHAVLVAWLLVAIGGLARRRENLRWSLRGPLGSLATRTIGLVLVLSVLGVLGIAVTGNLHRRFEKAVLTSGVSEALRRTGYLWNAIGAAFPIAPETPLVSDDLMTLALYLRQCTQPSDRIFMQHYLPQVVALAERGFAGGHADLRPGFFTSEQMQRLTVDRLGRQSVPVALLGPGDDLGGFRTSFPLVVRYFDEHYRNAGERVFGGRFSIRLLVRNDVHALGRFPPLDWPCFR